MAPARAGFVELVAAMAFAGGLAHLVMPTTVLAAFFAAHNPVLISVGLLEPEYDLSLQIEAMPQLLRRPLPTARLI